MGKEDNQVMKKQGLSIEQLNEQLDAFEGQKIQFEQNDLLLEFDKKNYGETLDRKIRMNKRSLDLINSNIAVVKKQIKKSNRNH